MLDRIRSARPTPALIISLIALFVALGGSGYAVTRLPKNSVGAKQIKKRAVGTSELRNGAVTRQKLKKGAVHASDVVGLAPGAVVGSGGAQNSSGPSPGQLITFNVPANRGETKTLATLGPFTLTGRCEPSASNIRATIDASTSASESFFESELLIDRDWNPGETREVQTHTAAPGSRTDASTELKMFNTASNAYTYVDDGETIGLLVGFQGADCRFIGHLVFYG